MDEQTVKQQQTTSPLGTTSGVSAAPRTDLPQGVYDYSEQIASMYDAQQAAKEQSLAAAYQQNVATMEREKAKISPLYQTQANDLSTQYERNRRNMNFQADLNGLNTGTGSQMQLAESNAYLNSFGKLRASEAAALTAAEQQMADLEISYKNAVAQALADNDYQKANALMQEYQRRDSAATAMQQYNRQQQEANAKLLAAYGDFSGYAELFGQETANSMRDFFLQANPDYAYANGLMGADQYYKLTGKYPNGYSSGSSGGGGGYTRSGNNGDDDGEDSDFRETVQQLILNGVPYADAVRMLQSSTWDADETAAGKAIIDELYQSTWKGGANEGKFNAAGNPTASWVSPTSVQPNQKENSSGYNVTTNTYRPSATTSAKKPSGGAAR